MKRVLRLSAALLVLGLVLAGYRGAVGQADPPKAAVLTAAPAANTTTATTAILDQPCKLDRGWKDITIGDLFGKLSDLHGVIFRLDTGFFNGHGVEDPYQKKVSLPIVKGMSVRDILEEMIASYVRQCGPDAFRMGIRVKGSQIIVGKAFVPPSIPGAYKVADNPGHDVLIPMISSNDIQDMMYGPTVSVAADKKPLADVIDQLRESSGANIAVDPRIKDKLATPVTLTANDTRLMTVLKLTGEMCDVAPAVVENMYYVTTRENADRLTRQTEVTIWGERQVAIPAGYVTDGFRLYEKPANLKPALRKPGGELAGGGFFDFPGPTGVRESVVKPPAPPPAPLEKK